MARVEVGLIAYRDKDGNFLPARPLYREVPDVDLEDIEDKLEEEFAKVIYAEMKAKGLIGSKKKEVLV